VTVRIIETQQAPTELAFRGAPSQVGERSSGGTFYNIVRKYYHALANPSEYVRFSSAEGGSATKALEVFHNRRYAVAAGIPGNAGYVDWFVENHCGLLNHILKGIDCKTSEHVVWSTPRIQVGDEVGGRIIETEQISPATRRFSAEGWEKFAPKRTAPDGGSLKEPPQVL
jgi:hypothetical protein